LQNLQAVKEAFAQKNFNYRPGHEQLKKMLKAGKPKEVVTL
jgi:hypothetical protein